jgi:hypothetical protein
MDLQRTLRTILISGGSTALVVVVGVAIATVYTARTTSERSRTRHHAALAKYHQEFLEDQRIAASLPVFAPRPGARDAGPLIGPRVSWAGAGPEALLRYRDSLPADERDRAPDPALGRKLGADWLHADPSLWSGLDFGWMSRLADLDYWDLDRNSPEPSSPGVAYRATPGAEVVSWAELRLAKGVRDGAPDAAFREVEELARLCATSEEGSTISMGFTLLALVEDARGRTASGGHAGAAAVRAAPDALRRAHRALWGALAHAELRTPDTYDADWDRISVGRCAALAHGLASAVTVRPVLADSHRAEYERLGRRLAAAPECRLRRLRRLWSDPASTSAVAARDERSWPVRLVRWVPGTQRLFGEMTVAVSEQDWFTQYEAPRAEPSPGNPSPR